jgi:hypothetical protein
VHVCTLVLGPVDVSQTVITSALLSLCKHRKPDWLFGVVLDKVAPCVEKESGFLNCVS